MYLSREEFEEWAKRNVWIYWRNEKSNKIRFVKWLTLDRWEGEKITGERTSGGYMEGLSNWIGEGSWIPALRVFNFKNVRRDTY